jgi:amidase
MANRSAAWWSPPTPATPYSAALRAAPPTGLRVGVLADAPLAGLSVDPACKAAVEVALTTLESLGHHVVDTVLPLPPLDEMIAAFTTLWNVGGAGVDLADPDRVEPHDRAVREAAHRTDSWAYARAVRRTQRLSRQIVEGFVAGVDLLVTPTMACLPPAVGAWRTGGDDPLMALHNSYAMAIFTSLFNVTGQPAISLPVHHDDATNLPVGVQVVAAPWQDATLLQVARDLELVHRWADRHPPT